MRRSFATVFWLGTKELRSLGHDAVLLGLILYTFTLMVYAQAQGNNQEVRNAAIAVVDEDRSTLSRSMIAALLPPYFKPAAALAPSEIDPAMDSGRYTFVLDIPPHFEREMQAGRVPAVQLQVDATAMMQAGIGAQYIGEIIGREIARAAAHGGPAPSPRVALKARVAFNPNVETAWFNSVMGIINSTTMLAIVLAGAAVIREREHGTMDHLLAMPLRPFEIALAKVWANGLVITTAAGLSLVLVVRGVLGVPVAGSVLLFVAGTALYLFFATAVGILLGTVARSMPQLGLLYMLVAIPMIVLSGASTPLESMPPMLQAAMQASPSTHFVAFAQAILYRGAGFAVVWPQFLAVALIGALFFALALRRFRRATGIAVT